MNHNLKIEIATRSISDELYEISGVFIEKLKLKRHRLLDTEADDYFYRLLDLDCDFVVNLDEDCFVSNPSRIIDLVLYMNDNGYHIAGMPDGGVCEHRFHNPLIPNAFFNIIDLRGIREKFNPLTARIQQYGDDLLYLVPQSLLKTKYALDNFEPYYPFFFDLLRNGAVPLYLNGFQWNRDPISTIQCDHKDLPFLIHTWYSRAFNEQRDRFNHAISWAKKFSKEAN